MYNVILRIEKETGDALIFHREPEEHPTLIKALLVYDGCYTYARLSYYHKDTNPAIDKKDLAKCQHLLDSLFKKSETYKIYKKLKY